ncbi:SDR family NAD(P)-dependent oxidoreductase [Caproiciproducens sp. MSJ-32]|uniref:SDR family NAD(P)-dependent oxidoreductase n=1 Tax=Caproiciproducens sp. MSJ-32 TaxID=2841527 RepID=UPI001C1211A8|nr:SDR family oxidoreductase [Caproiciproducens sp. MSJ-32]MBU5454477.1 SDR family oxidoreductase [Caproiciproducens sp. MSJ-32]
MEKVVLITGASSGIGLELSNIFAREGYNLLLVARNEEKLLSLKEKLEKDYKIKVEILSKDLYKREAAEEIYNFTKEKNIQVEILVNNAGFGDFGEFSSLDLKKQEEMINVNIMALVKLTYYYLKDMKRKNRGKIMNLASLAAFQPGPLMAVYYASKAFVLSFTEALSVELKDTDIDVLALCPGPTKTNFEEKANLETSGLFKNLKNATAKEVAEYGYKMLMKGRVVAVYGITNKTIACLGKFLPKALVRYASYLIQK